MNPVESPKNDDELLAAWHLHALKSRERHFTAATRLERFNYWLGIPVVGLSAIVGTSVFASLDKGVADTRIRFVVGAISVLAAVFAGLQTFLRFGERAEKHRVVATKYKAIVRHLEYLRARPLKDIQDADAQIRTLKDTLDSLESEAPVVTAKVWKIVEERFKRESQNA